ncbi:hypothetical protein K466DRAFT_270090 [Polyporus arcularius HHB13444]|uniref:Uncharacterized protein n=1 Tax=Polyporus arcularius HHB13444 TaxID=1314778 RepID=A0A5C3PQG4_9APHY|nr:hypothetical protein K466DRAFT_270090 [Polyporus arcularius HHB13444]
MLRRMISLDAPTSIGQSNALTLFLDLLWVIPRPLAQLPCNFLRRRAARCWTDSTGDHCSRICGLSSQVFAAKTSASKAFHCSLLPAWDTNERSLAMRRTSSRPFATTTPSGLPRLKRHSPGWTARRHRQRLSHSPVSRAQAILARCVYDLNPFPSAPQVGFEVNKYPCGRVFDKLEGTNTGRGIMATRLVSPMCVGVRRRTA